MEKKVYISAPISGYSIKERKKYFSTIARHIIDLGYKPVNPFDNGLPEESSYEKHLKQDIRMLLDCDMIVFGFNAMFSVGCITEERIALSCGIQILGHVDNEGNITLVNDD